MGSGPLKRRREAPCASPVAAAKQRQMALGGDGRREGRRPAGLVGVNEKPSRTSVKRSVALAE